MLDMPRLAQDPLPPQNLDAERSVLGACMIDRDAVGRALEILDGTGDFYRGPHQIIFDAMRALHGRAEPVDLITLTEELERQDRLVAVGGSEYLMYLLEVVPTAANVEHYARIVRQKHWFRELIAIGTGLVRDGYTAEDVQAASGTAIAALLKLQLRNEQAQTLHVKGLLDQLADRLDHGPTRLQSQRRTGLRALDAVAGGFVDSELWYVTGPPGGGKTTWALQSAYHLARTGEPVLVCSMELGPMRVVERLISIDGRIGGRILQYGPRHLFDEKMPDIVKSIDRVRGVPLYLTFGRVSTAQVTAHAQRVMAIEGRKLGALFVDRLEFFSDEVGRGKTYDRVRELSARTKGIATGLDIPVACLVQQSREGQRAEVPDQSSLRDSGHLENDAQTIVVIRVDRTTKRARFHVVKQNDGPTGVCDEVYFDPEIPGFYDLEERQPEPHWSER